MAYENFMCNKDFHPSNYRNIRKVWEAQQKQEQEARRQEELRQQYLKEQEQYKSKELMGKANPLGFMYEPPPGLAKDKEKKDIGMSKEEGEPKLKFDWQKPGRSAPREEYAKDLPLRDKPFGVEVRNVKCIKCGKWGHINTDRECPYFGKAKPQPEDGESRIHAGPLPDIDTMEDGLVFRQCVRGRVVDREAVNQQIVASEDEGEAEDLLAGFSKKQQRKILRKLARMEEKESGAIKHKKKHKKPKRKKSRKESSSDTDDSGSKDHGERERERERRRRRRRRRKRRQESSSDTDDSGNKDHGERERERRRKRRQESEESGSDDYRHRHRHRQREEISRQRSRSRSPRNKSRH